MRLLLKVIIVYLIIASIFDSSLAEVDELYSLLSFNDKNNKTTDITESDNQYDDDAIDDKADDKKPDDNIKTTPAPSALDWDEIRAKLHASLSYVTRCSRRFYPGICSEPVVSVWTFSFSYQNCTERLGCRFSSLANRFRTYSRCIFNCRPLIDVYMHILAYQESVKSHNHDSDALSDDYESSEEYEDSLRKAKTARRRGLSTLENLISSVQEDYGNFDEPTLGFPESHDGEPPEEIQRSIPQDLDKMDQEDMDVNYDFNTGRHRLKGRLRGLN